MIDEIKARLADKARWLKIGTFSEQEYQEKLKRNRAGEAERQHLSQKYFGGGYAPTPKQQCGCQRGSYGCTKCNPAAYAGGGFFSNDPEVTS